MTKDCVVCENRGWTIKRTSRGDSVIRSCVACCQLACDNDAIHYVDILASAFIDAANKSFPEYFKSRAER